MIFKMPSNPDHSRIKKLMGNLLYIECFSTWSPLFASFNMFSPCVSELLVLLYHRAVKEITPLINNNMNIELWPHSGEIPVSLQTHKQFNGFFSPFVVVEN